MNDLDLYFEYKCWKGLKDRKLDHLEIYRQRLEYEIYTIKSLGFSGYFLVVQDMINWAKENNIYVGPGRGSVAGALCAYCLKITNLDPLEMDLIFERFLNPGRAPAEITTKEITFERFKKELLPTIDLDKELDIIE